MKKQFGCFLILVGLLVGVVFTLMELSGQPDFDYFFLALILLVVGMLLRRQPKTETEPRYFRKIRSLRRLSQKKEKEGGNKS